MFPRGSILLTFLIMLIMKLIFVTGVKYYKISNYEVHEMLSKRSWSPETVTTLVILYSHRCMFPRGSIDHNKIEMVCILLKKSQQLLDGLLWNVDIHVSQMIKSNNVKILWLYLFICLGKCLFFNVIDWSNFCSDPRGCYLILLHH